MAEQTERVSLFRHIAGIEVYSATPGGEPMLWYCPKCSWWRRWELEQCERCKTKRPESE